MEINVQSLAVLSASLSALAAAVSATTAFRSYRLSIAMQEEAKFDERIFIGKISHPSLALQAHADCVLQIPLFNRSKRKACVTELIASDSKGELIVIAWSDVIDNLGNVQDSGSLVGVTDAKTIYVRRSDGEQFKYARFMLAHSFSASREVAIFDCYADFV